MIQTKANTLKGIWKVTLKYTSMDTLQDIWKVTLKDTSMDTLKDTYKRALHDGSNDTVRLGQSQCSRKQLSLWWSRIFPSETREDMGLAYR